MKLKRADWTFVREAEEKGLMAGMTGLVQRNRTDLNTELSNYFREQLPDYGGSFDEHQGEDVLFSVNEYLKENDIDKHSLHFPVTSGTEIHLIPINENIQLKLVVADEYYGDGDYAKYVMANFFMINNSATKEDVDLLVDFIQKHLLPAL